MKVLAITAILLTILYVVLYFMLVEPEFPPSGSASAMLTGSPTYPWIHRRLWFIFKPVELVDCRLRKEYWVIDNPSRIDRP